MDIAPGIKAKVSEGDAQEIAELRAKLATQKLADEDDYNRKVAEIMQDVEARCKRLEGPIFITDEMRELKIDKQVWDMIQRYELMAPFMRAFGNDDDDYADEE